MKTAQQILDIFLEQGFYCSVRSILDQSPNQSDRYITDAVKEARRLGLQNIETTNNHKLTMAIAAYQTKERLELQRKTNELISLLFTE